MATYPAALSTQNSDERHTPITPSHGGTVFSGNEFDMPIAQPPPSSYNPATAAAAAGAPPPPSRQSTSNGHKRPRPVSLPPQSQSASTSATMTSSDTPGKGEDRHHHRSATTTKSRTNRILGDYTLSKTLGAGSMGKVKLATHNITGEQLAVKILPRSQPTPAQQAAVATTEAAVKQASRDASKEIRTMREAGLSMLLHHPYICGMREMIIHQHHYYMVFEYVNGGQMLDYIISHGRLRERVARKFARQIGSALDYCHKNNVVHRDLKIENILISQTGNIKIIDFGLSNLYDPVAHLATFCGSLYFAAPELLNARVYTGPEVDVWSFGVVLYVLVCGKVPFDDQSMPALHAKIKRGHVEYPVWLSAECRHLLSRMLVTNPSARASLAEVMGHPWMVRGFTGPPETHLLHREPLRADELDRQVIATMQGFDFGSDADIERKLIAVLDSESYARAVQNWERKRHGTLNGSGKRWGESFSNSSLAVSYDSTLDNSTPSRKSRRFSGFDFYRKKLFSSSSSPPGTPSLHSPLNSQSTLIDGNKDAVDPTHGFHPLISMYFLAREKLERERVYGPGHFASSQLSIQESAPPPPAQPAPSPTVAVEDTSKDNKADYNMALPRLPAPAESHYSGMSYDANGPTPSPTSTSFHPQPRARDAGVPSLTPSNSATPTPHTPTTPTPTTTSMPRAPPASTHRRSHSLSQRPTVLRGWGGMFGGATETVPENEPPRTAGPALETFSEKQEHRPEAVNEKEKEQEDLAHPTGTGAGLVRKFGSILTGRGEDGHSLRRPSSKRSTILSPGTPTEDGRKVSTSEKTSTDTESAPQTKATSQTATLPSPSSHRRAATILDPQGARVKHERRSSTGAALLSNVTGGTIGRHRRPSTGFGASRPTNDRPFGRTEEENEEAENAEDEGSKTDTETLKMSNGQHGVEPSPQSDKDFKPLFLKGLFSVATTSSKSPSIIKADVRRVLQRMQVQYRETKGGFECIHLPSIDMSGADPSSTKKASHDQQVDGSAESGSGLVKKTSKLSIGTRKGKEREPSFDNGSKLRATTSNGSSSFFNGAQSVEGPTNGNGDGASATLDVDARPPSRSASIIASVKSKVLPPIPRDFAVAVGLPTTEPIPTGEVDNELFERMGNHSLSVRFDINIVKVPWLPLHGIQFRRAGGDGWQYQMLARRVLTELKL